MMDNALWVLVTGASTGIGRATTQFLASNGFHVYAGARKVQDLKDLEKISNVIPVKIDVTNKSDIQAVINLINQKKSGLYGLVNNAGIGVAGPLMETSVEDLRSQFEVNLFGIHQVTRAVFPFLLQSKGRIVMMSSDSGFFATPFFGPYCASKFAVEGYSDSLRRELILYGIKIILIQPGRISTQIWWKGEQYIDKFNDSIFATEAKGVAQYAIQKGKTAGLSPIEVAKVVYKALSSPKPKIRYLVAAHKLKYRMVKILPASSVDNMVVKELRAMKAEASKK
jgi:short-subunit dehydrogenase